jgi:hypothetical protein
MKIIYMECALKYLGFLTSPENVDLVIEGGVIKKIDDIVYVVI